MSDDDGNSEHGNNFYDSEFNQRKTAIPIKPHLKQIEENLRSIRTESEENKKFANKLKGELTSLGNTCKEKCNDIIKSTIDSIHNLDKEFKRTVQQDKTETDFFKSMIQALTQEKLKIKNTTINLDSRLKQCEIDVGMGWGG